MTKLPFANIYKHDKPVTTKLTKYEYDNLKKYCKKHNLKMSFVIREMITYWLNKENNL